MARAEAHVEQYLKSRVEAAGGLCYKFTSATRGVPDRVIVLNGRTVFIETKSRSGTASPIQRVQIRRINDRGGDARLCNTRELVDALIDELTGDSART